VWEAEVLEQDSEEGLLEKRLQGYFAARVATTVPTDNDAENYLPETGPPSTPGQFSVVVVQKRLEGTGAKAAVDAVSGAERDCKACCRREIGRGTFVGTIEDKWRGKRTRGFRGPPPSGTSGRLSGSAGNGLQAC
jgi:hypothetical protein